MGLWNEHPPTPDYALFLRAALDRSKHGAATQIVGPDWHTSPNDGPGDKLHPFMQARDCPPLLLIPQGIALLSF